MPDSFDDEDDDLETSLPADAPGFFERIPLALEVLTVATLAGTVKDAKRLAAAPATLAEDAAKGTADKLRELQDAFRKDLEQLTQKWMGALGPIDASDEQDAKAKMNLIMVAGLTSLGTRYHLVRYLLRQTVPKERIVALDKICQKTAREFLRGPANGQPGIRRVK